MTASARERAAAEAWVAERCSQCKGTGACLTCRHEKRAYLAGAAAEREAVLAEVIEKVRGHIARCAKEQSQPEESQGDCYHEGRTCDEAILQELEALK